MSEIGRSDLELKKFALDGNGLVSVNLSASNTSSPLTSGDIDDLETKKFTAAAEVRVIQTF